jgi:metallo-beta-lactamase class B
MPTWITVKPAGHAGDGESVTLGGVRVVAHLTPGHTPGCTTWTLQADDEGARRDVVFVCSTCS